MLKSLATIILLLVPLAAGADVRITEIGRLSGPSGRGVQFSADGSRLIVAGRAEAWVWDTATSKPILKKLPYKSLEDWQSDMSSARISPDGTKAVVTTGVDARLFDVATGRELLVARHGNAPAEPRFPKGVWAADFSPDGEQLATGGGAGTAWTNGTACLWDIASGKLVATLQHQNPVGMVRYTSDGRTLITGAGSLHFWRLADAKDIGPVIRSVYGKVASSADGRRVAYGMANRVIVCDGPMREELLYVFGDKEMPVGSVDLSADGNLCLAAIDNEAKLWDLRDPEKEPRQLIDPHAWEPVQTAALSTDGSLAVTGGTTFLAEVGGRIAIWDTRTGKQLHHTRGRSNVTAAAFSSDGRFVAVTCDEPKDGLGVTVVLAVQRDADK